MNNKIILPMEIINSILSFRPIHPVAQLLKHSMMEYKDTYNDEPNDLSFNEYLNEGGLSTTIDESFLYYTFFRCGFKLLHNRNDIELNCYDCGCNIKMNDLFYKESNTNYCGPCVYD